MEIAIILLLIVLNGLFAMSEVALISARRSKLSAKARSGNKAAQRALSLAEDPDRFLSTVQIGITLIGIVTGIYSGETLALEFAEWLRELGVGMSVAQPLSNLTIVVIITYFTIVFGELVPKRLGMNSAERVAMLVARPMHFVATLAKPFVWLLSKSIEVITKVLRIEDEESKVTEDEIRSIVREGAEDGEVQEVEQKIVERVFSLGDRKVVSIMTHRNDMAMLDLSMTIDEVRQLVTDTPHSLYPVFEAYGERLMGVVYLKDLFLSLNEKDFNLKSLVRSAKFFHDETEVYEALEQLRKEQVAYGLVIDEYGVMQGIVTRCDVLEALVGAMPDAQEEPDIVTREDGSCLVDGQCPFYDFLAYWQMEDLPQNEYNTISGLVLDELGHIPSTGERMKWHEFEFEVVDMDGARIDKLLVVKLPQEKL